MILNWYKFKFSRNFVLLRIFGKQGRRQVEKSGVDTHGERGDLAAEPPAGSGAEPLVSGSGGQSPPEAENLFSFRNPTEAPNLFHSAYFINSLNPRHL